MSNKKNNSEKSGFEDIDKLIDNTFNRIKDLVDANTVIGSTIKLNEKLFIIPISKVSVGIISGGGEVPGPKSNKSINAGSTTGFSLTPIGFVTINDNSIEFIGSTIADVASNKILDMCSGIFEKIMSNSEVENEEN